ncbi:MAG TPA: hypothetical protein VF753_06120 [Terriglobales bacterium]
MTRPNRKNELSANGRPTVVLTPEVEKRLSAYAGSALAAGVGLLAISQSANAKVVYTKADVTIPVHGDVALDLNHDGITDFTLWNNFSSPNTYPPISYATLSVRPGTATPSNQVWGQGLPDRRRELNRFAFALRSGISVGANKSYFRKSPRALMAGLNVFYRSAAAVGASCSPQTGGCISGTNGQWMYTSKRYLGLEFVISGQTHYGWARVTVSRSSGFSKNYITATLTGYAYETIPNKPILTGATTGSDVVTLEPVILGRLAQGSEALTTWREKK